MILDFRRSMVRRNLRRSTIDKRVAVVGRWLDEVGDRWSTACDVDVEEFLDRRRLGPRTRYCEISHLHMFYVWARRTGACSIDPTELIERPRLPRRLPRPARSADVDVVLAAGVDVATVAIGLMADAGLRCCEVAALSWADIDLVARRVYVCGKGGHDRVVGIPARLLTLLAGVDVVEGPVLGRVCTPARVSQLVNARLRSSGVPATAHQLRHLYATRLLEATGGNLLAVQQALGHASVTSTQIYAQVDPAAALRAAESL